MGKELVRREMTELEIRPARPEDLAGILTLERACFRPPWTERSLSEEMNDPDGLTLAALRGGRLAGFCMMHRAGDQAELYQIAVCPEERRAGVALELLRSAETAAGGRGMGEAFLEVRASNAPAVGLYEKAGWRRLGTRRNYYVDPVEDALLYGKELKE
ncbi:MAG: ribosomal protein S18-alanine N-acetyltransferase [Oscillospiraceae bacterium]|nr:ribosomal protein S18-alanine N-acetyltransferase [Oscillospiraceae bacterium]